MKRVISALCILPPLLLLMRFGSSLFLVALIISVASLGLIEFYRLLSAKGLPCWRWLGMALGGTLPLAFHLRGQPSQAAVTGMVIITLLVALTSRKEMLVAVQSAALTLLGVFYVGWLLSYVLLLRLLSDGPGYVFYLFAVVWLGDAAALVCGTLVGRHKLAPAISPGKTIEGAVGGLVGSLGAAVVGGFWLLGHFSLTHGLILGGLLALLGQLGDLSESLLKRAAGVKDSAGFIPGHGGILDKIDGILFGAPALYYYIICVLGHEPPS